MTAYPLETPLCQLSPARRVYIVRRGLVFLYPARIVADIANNRYTMDDDRPWHALPADWDAGKRLADRVAAPWTPASRIVPGNLKALAATLWRTEGGSSAAFAEWWDSVNPDAHPEWIGAAARVAARELMTWPLFKLRHQVDDTQVLA